MHCGMCLGNNRSYDVVCVALRDRDMLLVWMRGKFVHEGAFLDGFFRGYMRFCGSMMDW